MMIINSYIHDVKDVQAVRYTPDNNNAVSVAFFIQDPTTPGSLTASTTLYFGSGDEQAARALAFFKGCGGKDEDINDVKTETTNQKEPS